MKPVKFYKLNRTTINLLSIDQVTFVDLYHSRYSTENYCETHVSIVYNNGYKQSILCSQEQYDTLQDVLLAL